MFCVLLQGLSAAAFRLPRAASAPTAPDSASMSALAGTDCGGSPLDGVSTEFNAHMLTGVKGLLDIAYTGRDIPRFYVLETIARVPYFSYLSCLHLYESLGLRGNAKLMRMHYAEADNELHHLLIMEALGGSSAFVDRFVAQHLAFGYFWYCVILYLVHPRAAYHLSELVEEHAYATYDKFLTTHESELRRRPVPDVARRYYEGSDAMRAILQDDAKTRNAAQPQHQVRKLQNLYDVFERIRDDEAAHWDTLDRLVSYESLEIPEGCEVVEA